MAQLTTRQHLVATLAFLRADGTPGVIAPDSVAVTSSDPATITALLLPDGTVDVVALATGSATIVVTASTTAGQITGTSEVIDVVVDPRDAEATSAAITLGVPIDRPAV